jgi:hypothetical protein
MSYKPEFEVMGEAGVFYQNGQTFATREEAEQSAMSRFRNWAMAIGWRVAEVDSAEFPVNYRWDDELGDVMLE